MIRIVEDDKRHKVIKKKMPFSSDIFTVARDFYHEHEDYRDEQIAVTDGAGNIMYMLEWVENQITYPRLSKDVTLNLYVSQFWDYDIKSDRIDTDYISDIDVFCFKTVEEYSIATSKLILTHFPEKRIIFKEFFY